MFADDVLALIRQRPFVPFRIHLAGNLTYDVKHPDNVLVTLAALHVGVKRRSDSDVPDKVDIINTQQIIRVEPLLPENAA